VNIFTDKQKVQDLIFLCFITVFAVIVSFSFKTNLFTSAILFSGLPALYLLYKEKKYFGKIFLASITFGIFFCFNIEFIAELNKMWAVEESPLWGRVLGIVQVDTIWAYFLWMFYMLLFYEHFIDRKKLKSAFSMWGLRVYNLSVLSVIVLVLVYTFFPFLLYFEKAYFTVFIIISIPFIAVVYKKPKVVWHTLPIVLYFFFAYLVQEITALRLGQWSFPGDYIGWVSMFGISFPLEELFFWVILSSLIGSVYYELSFDNQEN